MRLLSDFEYRDPDDLRWLAPHDSLVDGASIPQPLWSLVGSPFTGRYRDASVVHDVACVEQTQPWQLVHRMFYNACRCGGVGEVRAKVMYAAVFHFGPRWQASGRGPAAFAPAQRGPRVEENFEALKAYVETNNPSLEEIETVAP
jgi:hypothetical protein